MSLLVILIIIILLFGAGGYVGRGPIYGSPVYAGGYGIVGLILVVGAGSWSSWAGSEPRCVAPCRYQQKL